MLFSSAVSWQTSRSYPPKKKEEEANRKIVEEKEEETARQPQVEVDGKQELHSLAAVTEDRPRRSVNQQQAPLDSAYSSTSCLFSSLSSSLVEEA